MKKIEDFSITKTTVECYKVRHPSGMYWADITIDANEKGGRIQVASDYGSFQYYWGAAGDSFKKFLTEIGIDYAADKFEQNKWFDEDATLKGIKELINERHLPKEEKTKVLKEFKELTDSGFSNSHEFVDIFFQKTSLSRLYDNIPDIQYSIKPQFKKFWNECWQVFINQLRSESNG